MALTWQTQDSTITTGKTTAIGLIFEQNYILRVN